MEKSVSLSDQELLAAYRAGSTEAGELFFQRYSVLVERYIRAHVRDVEDVYNLRQEVLLRVLTWSKNDLSGDRSFVAVGNDHYGQCSK